MAATALQLIFAALAGLIVGRSLAEQPAALEILPELASGDTELHPDPAGEEDEEEEAMTEELINSCKCSHITQIFHCTTLSLSLSRTHSVARCSQLF